MRNYVGTVRLVLHLYLYVCVSSIAFVQQTDSRIDTHVSMFLDERSGVENRKNLQAWGYSTDYYYYWVNMAKVRVHMYKLVIIGSDQDRVSEIHPAEFSRGNHRRHHHRSYSEPFKVGGHP